MSNSVTQYNAKRLRYLMNDIKLPTIKEIVEEKVLSSNEKLKKDEIDDHVSKAIGFPMDKSISVAVSGELRKLEKEEIVRHVSHGYWQKV